MTLVLEVYDILLAFRAGDKANSSSFVHVAIGKCHLEILEGDFNFG